MVQQQRHIESPILSTCIGIYLQAYKTGALLQSSYKYLI